MKNRSVWFALTLVTLVSQQTLAAAAETQPSDKAAKPNIILIYTDDIGYADLSCYGAKRIQTPYIDQLATEGMRFTDAHSTSATCTPSRYSLLTGTYAFRNKRAQILQGDAPLLIEPGSQTMPELLRKTGYTTACIGKWHLGLGEGNVDWNSEIKPGPLEVGFDVSYIMAATNDRVPCVYIDGHRVDNLDPADPIQVSYRKQVGNLPTGRSNPELLRFPADGQHSGTIINNISRIGYMTGGKAAWWTDETMAEVFTAKAVEFIKKQKGSDKPFFLFFSLHDNHAPCAPHDRFVGQSDCGMRCDAVLQADWCVGEVLKTLKQHNLDQNTMVIFSSDNGPVIHDGYDDGSLQETKDHDPSGPWRGGKYQAWEGGTRLPFLVRWPAKIKPGVSDALISQVDLLASFMSLLGKKKPAGVGLDSRNVLPALLGKSPEARKVVLLQAPGVVSIREGNWKYIPAGKRIAWAHRKHNHELGTTNSPRISEKAQLYNLETDPGEERDLIAEHPEVAERLAKLLAEIRQTPRFAGES